MEAALNEHRELEKNLKATLLTAQKLADDIKAQAEREAKRIVREAEGRSDLLLEKTQARLEDIQRGIDGLKLKRQGRRDHDRGDDPELRNTLEFVREQEAHERDDRILLHRPRLAEAADEAADRRRVQADPDANNPTGVELDVRPFHAHAPATSMTGCPTGCRCGRSNGQG